MKKNTCCNEKKDSGAGAVTELIAYLNKDTENKKLIKELKKISNLDDNNIYSILLKILTHLDFTEQEALIHWNKIIAHKDDIEEKLDRCAGLRVALIDYFINIEKRLKNPKFIEISLYEKTRKQVITDTLTGLYNYHFFRTNLKKEIDRSKRYNSPLTIVMIDIDNFKQYNDTFGHLNGDQMLKAVSRIMRVNIRLYDSISIYRYGGEEFVLLLPNTDKIEALSPAKRVLSAVKNYDYESDNIPCARSVTVSMGIASFPLDSTDQNGLIDKADKALYQAKYEGKNRVCLFSSNRRRHIRLSFECVIEFEPLITVTKLRSGKLKDISEGGIAFYSMEHIALKTGLKIKIFLENQKQAKEVVGKVARVKKLSKKSSYPYEIGVEFETVEEKTMNELSEILKIPKKKKKG